MKRTPIERLVRAYRSGHGVYLRTEDVQELFTVEPGHAQGWTETALGHRLCVSAEEAEYARVRANGGTEEE